MVILQMMQKQQTNRLKFQSTKIGEIRFIAHPGLTAWLGANNKYRMNRQIVPYSPEKAKSLWMMIVSALILASVLSSCNRKDELPQRIDTEEIKLAISEGQAFTSAVKSAEEECSVCYSELLFSDENLGDVYLEVIESDIQSESPDTFEVATKGSPYSGNNIGSFTVVSYVEGEDEPYFTKSLTSSGGVVSTGYYWPFDVKVDFFGYARSNGNGTMTTPVLNPSGESGSFTYTLPGTPDDLTSAVEQPDIVFAISPNQSNTGSAVPMKFHHALSSIAFNAGNVPAQFKVVDITFTNISSKADCSFSLSGSFINFNWSNYGSKRQFVQSFEEEVGGAPDQAINTAEESFMLIPQTIGNDAKIRITVSFENRKYIIEKGLNAITPLWAPGKKYLFRISSPNEVEVEINETFTHGSNVKKDVFFTNTGLSTIKMRAAIVGYWVVKSTINGVEQECIIADWEPEVHGTFEGLPGSGWTKNTVDGYYYYNAALSPKAKTNNLFNSYTLTTSPPIIGAELVLTIVGQAIIDGYEDSTWNKAN